MAERADEVINWEGEERVTPVVVDGKMSGNVLLWIIQVGSLR